MSAIDPLRVPPPSPVGALRRVQRERRDDERHTDEDERREPDERDDEPTDDGAPHVDVRA